MSAETFRTVAGQGSAGFVVNGSRFLGHVHRVDSVDEAESLIATVRSRYEDATHTVPAYRIRSDPLREWASDDGEPSGSAGKPVLNVLQRNGLENVVAVVTRYYGGTNLGVGGLSRAYGRAVADAVDDAGVVTAHPRQTIRAVVSYDDSGTVQSVLESEGLDFEADYETEVTYVVDAPADAAQAIRDRLRSSTNGRVVLDADTA